MNYFAYGTLKKGFCNHKLMEYINTKYIGEGFLVGYRMYDLGGYPTIIETKNIDDMIFGEVYDVESFDRLDILEGVSWHHYDRVKLPIFLNGEYGNCKINCQVYIAGRNKSLIKKTAKVIEDGKWIKK